MSETYWIKMPEPPPTPDPAPTTVWGALRLAWRLLKIKWRIGG